MTNIALDKLESLSKQDMLAISLLGSFKAFCDYFFPRMNGGQVFRWTSYRKAVADSLLKTYLLNEKYKNINMPPGTGKTTLITYFMAWTIANNPRVCYIYTSFSEVVAVSKTSVVYDIVRNLDFMSLFDVRLAKHTSSKSHFKTTAGGTIIAVGANASVTSFDAGFSTDQKKLYVGGLVIDDAHKPEEVFSTLAREKVINTYFSTLETRLRSINSVIINIAQRTHESDLSSIFIQKKDHNDWVTLEIPFYDKDKDTVIDETIMAKDKFLLKLNDPRESYKMWTQYQQTPIPLGNTLINVDDIKLLNDLPKFDRIIITGDCAETTKFENDATAFSAFGIYELEFDGVKSGQAAMVWLECEEMWVEPADLVSRFMLFYSSVLQRFGPIESVMIENKSMGVALNSFLMQRQGVRCIPLIRTNKFSKMDRIASIQPYIRGGFLGILKNAVHKDLVFDHLAKITISGSHARDDIADTLADGITHGLLESNYQNMNDISFDSKVKSLAQVFQ